MGGLRPIKVTHYEAGDKCLCEKLECGGVEHAFVYCPEHGIDAGPVVPIHEHIIGQSKQGW